MNVSPGIHGLLHPEQPTSFVSLPISPLGATIREIMQAIFEHVLKLLPLTNVYELMRVSRTFRSYVVAHLHHIDLSSRASLVDSHIVKAIATRFAGNNLTHFICEPLPVDVTDDAIRKLCRLCPSLHTVCLSRVRTHFASPTRGDENPANWRVHLANSDDSPDDSVEGADVACSLTEEAIIALAGLLELRVLSISATVMLRGEGDGPGDLNDIPDCELETVVPGLELPSHRDRRPCVVFRFEAAQRLYSE